VPRKPHESEDEYFARVDMEKRKALAADRAKAMAEDDRRRLKDTHFMHCPKDGHDLVTVSLHGVQVEQCGQCNGMWLDAGELDELVESDRSGLIEKLRNVFRGE
jgi:hypothetical protein